MLTRISLVLSLALAACGGSSKPEAPVAPTAPVAPPAAGAALELGEITLFAGANAVFKLHASGASELGGQDNGAPGWKPGPTFKADGTIEENGVAKAKINADGSITGIGTPDKVEMTVTADKATIPMDKGALEIALAADGKVTLSGLPPLPANAEPRVEGADTAGKRRTALILMALVLATSSAPPAPPPAK